jgi:prepilin peptidase CpaA
MHLANEQGLALLSWVLRLFVLCLLVAAAFTDWRSFKIPNSVSLVIVLTGALFATIAPSGGGLLSPELFGSAGFRRHLIAFAVALLLGFSLFALKLWGAGDAKLLAAVSIWNPYSDLPLLLLSVCCVGGVVALAITVAKGTWRTTLSNLRSIFIGSLVGAPVTSAELASSGSRMPFSLAISGGWCAYAIIRLNS